MDAGSDVGLRWDFHWISTVRSFFLLVFFQPVLGRDTVRILMVTAVWVEIIIDYLRSEVYFSRCFSVDSRATCTLSRMADSFCRVVGGSRYEQWS